MIKNAINLYALIPTGFVCTSIWYAIEAIIHYPNFVWKVVIAVLTLLLAAVGFFITYILKKNFKSISEETEANITAPNRQIEAYETSTFRQREANGTFTEAVRPTGEMHERENEIEEMTSTEEIDERAVVPMYNPRTGIIIGETIRPNRQTEAYEMSTFRQREANGTFTEALRPADEMRERQNAIEEITSDEEIDERAVVPMYNRRRGVIIDETIRSDSEDMDTYV